MNDRNAGNGLERIYIDMLKKEKQDDINSLSQQLTPYNVQRFQSMQKRKANSLIESRIV